MDSASFQGFVLDPAKCSKLSMEEKRELVYEISKWSNGAPELLQSWSRQDILQILCAEMGKERKYTGLTKLKIIENLLKVVSEKTSVYTDLESEPSSQRVCKRQRKPDHPNRIPSASNNIIDDNDSVNNFYCKNSACKAKLSVDDRFCKRCSCCICYQFDDNKDPSLWLTCSSDPPFEGNKDSCGLSCHLECALKEDRSGISKNLDDTTGLDGSFCCVSCGNVNDLLGCWRKQMITARDTRRVDILCYRVSLGQKLLSGTNRYKKLHEIVSDAMKKLEEEVGPLTGLPVKKARGIVNRLSSGQEVQRLCAYAAESLDIMLSDSDTTSNSSAPLLQGSNAVVPHVQFENVGPTFLTVNVGSEGSSQENGIGYTLWHRMTNATEYSSEPVCTLFAPNTRYSISNLTPSTEYLLKVVSFNSTGKLATHEVQFQTCSDDNNKVLTPKNALKLERSQSPVTNCSSLSNPVAVGPITSVPKSDVYLVNNEDSPETQAVQETSTENDSNTPVQSGLECVPFAGSSDSVLPVTPCKLDTLKDVGPGRKIRTKNSNDKNRSSKKREECAENGDRDFGYYVKVIRRLECDGHIETSFRQKFLTWYSLKANPQEVRIVKVFVDNLLDEPTSLAGQLVDTFSDVISNKRPSSIVPMGLCLRLWHS